jgi:hypothetical protein
MIPPLFAATLALLAVVLGPHMFLMLASTVIAAAVLLLAWRIDQLTMQTGWGVIPVRRPKATGAAW